MKDFEPQKMEIKLYAKEVNAKVSKPIDWDAYGKEVADIAKEEFTSFVHRTWVLCPYCKHDVPTFDRQLAECFLCTTFEAQQNFCVHLSSRDYYYAQSGRKRKGKCPCSIVAPQT